MGASSEFTYKAAGVNVEAGNRAVELMKERLKSTQHPLVLGGLGGFGGAMRLPKYKDPVLVAGTDGVGTKIELARTMGTLGSIGIDLVAMSVNDVSACGAVPLFFLDYLVDGKVVPEEVAEIVGGVDEGCVLAQCVLLGGETAEHPGQFPDGDFDLAGFAVGPAVGGFLAARHYGLLFVCDALTCWAAAAVLFALRFDVRNTPAAPRRAASTMCSALSLPRQGSSISRTLSGYLSRCCPLSPMAAPAHSLQ